LYVNYCKLDIIVYKILVIIKGLSLYTTSTYSDLDVTRREVSKTLDPDRRSEFGQFMTPNSIASFMSSLFTYNRNIKLLDPGAGIGSLTSAFLESSLNYNSTVHVEAWEIDSSLIPYLDSTINHWKRISKGKINYQINTEDFIKNACFQLGMGKDNCFSHAILNPPYKKINSHSKYRFLLRDVGIETVNLYSAFVALCIKLLADKGELVAIIPRSFCNGAYYLPFRKLLLENTAIKQIHLFKSRNKAFSDDDVLQENIIIHLVKNVNCKNVIVSTSLDSEFEDYAEHKCEYSFIVDQNSVNKFIHIPTNESEHHAPGICTDTLTEIGLEVSTGPIVDFRVKDYLQKDITNKSIPLIYSFNFVDGKLIWPKEHKKPNSLIMSPDLIKQLMPNGNYVFVKRFSSKEEKKRLVAYHLSPNNLNSDLIGIENHINVYHFRKKGIDEYLARGLTVFLNSTIMDNYFRVFSGHTQVNATDLRTILYPSREKLIKLGKKSCSFPNNQVAIDSLIGEM
jgi:adenine-specific DNA-methyltransferase